MTFAQLCFEMLYGKDSTEAILLHNSVMDILKRLFEEYSGYVKISTTVSGSNSSQSHGTDSQTQDQAMSDTFAQMDVENDLGYERMDSLYKELVSDIGIQDPNTELEIYLKENIENPNLVDKAHFDVLSWWKSNALKFSILSAIAKDILAMQISTVASESAFSTSGRILNPSRSCLTHKMIQVLMCLQQWLKSEFHINDKVVLTIQEILSDIELQDDLMKELEKYQDLCD